MGSPDRQGQDEQDPAMGFAPDDDAGFDFVTYLKKSRQASVN